MIDLEQRRLLLSLARECIEAGLLSGSRVPLPKRDWPKALLEPGACVVTLRLGRDLRGVAGSTEPVRALYEDLWHNAWTAAFADARFGRVRGAEWRHINIHVCVLSPARPLRAWSEARLLKKLRPNEDGIILEYRGTRTTFPPSAWEQIPDPRDFMAYLKLKAGLPTNFWSREIRLKRFAAVHCAELEISAH